jgi:hypothetical protein
VKGNFHARFLGGRGRVNRLRLPGAAFAHDLMSTNPPKGYGAAAVGKTSRFDVVIDEALEDASDIQMSISTRSWSFHFALSGRDDVARMLSFLREQTGRLVFSEIAVGSFHGARVLLIKDDEFAERFWLRAHGVGHMVEFVLAADDLLEFTDAVAQAVQDLQN